MKLRKAQFLPPIVGKIKIGEKVNNNGKTYPKSTDHFLIKFDQPMFQKAVGDHFNSQKIASIPIRFATANDDFNIYNALEVRDSSGKLYAYTDLDKLFVANKERKGDAYLDVTAQAIERQKSIEAAVQAICQTLSTEKYKCEAKEVLRLRFSLANTDLQGCFELRTSASKSSIQGIVDAYEASKNSLGDITEARFMLSVKMHTSNRSGISSVYPVLQMIPIFQRQSDQVLIENNSSQIKFLK